MTSEALYEQYKDALKRGHVSSLRGRIDEALLAYAEAARIAPERSTPHASAGTALLRRKQPADALRHYEVALSIAPHDELALLGRAQALAALDRRGEAADAFDVLAEIQAVGGRLADAVDAARRGLEMAEGRERRRTLERLIVRLRASEPGEPGRVALELALQVLDGPAVPHPAAAMVGHHATFGQVTAAEPVTATDAVVADVAAGAAGAPPAPTVGTGAAGAPPAPAVGVGAAFTAELAKTALAGGAADEPAPGGAFEAGASDEGLGGTFEAGASGVASDEGLGASPHIARAPAYVTPSASRAIPDAANVAELTARADAAAEAGVPALALDALLDLAALHVRDGRIEAALEACYTALSFDPDSLALHLALVEVYTVRGWDALANEKLDLLERLARLDGDAEGVADVVVARAARG